MYFPTADLKSVIRLLDTLKSEKPENVE